MSSSNSATNCPSIPISVIATFGLLFFTGLTLNQMTFGGLALGIGLIVGEPRLQNAYVPVLLIVGILGAGALAGG